MIHWYFFLQRGVFVAGLKEEIVNSAEQVLKLIQLGEGLTLLWKTRGLSYLLFISSAIHSQKTQNIFFYRSTIRNSMRDFSTQCVFMNHLIFQLSTYFVWSTSIFARSAMTTTAVSLYI